MCASRLLAQKKRLVASAVEVQFREQRSFSERVKSYPTNSTNWTCGVTALKVTVKPVQKRLNRWCVGEPLIDPAHHTTGLLRS